MITETNNKIAGRYAPCRRCSAINMSHREFCYRCRLPFTSPTEETLQPAEPKSKYYKSPSLAPNRRRLTRKRITITGVGVGGQVIFKHHGTALDITPLGICIRTAFPCKIGAKLDLLVPLEGRIHRLSGVICHREEGEKDSIAIYTYGIQLDPPLPETLAAIERL